MTQLQQILQIIEHLGKATPGDISQEMRLTRRDVEKRIYKLVNLGKIKVISKAGHNINGNASNVYCIKEVELDIKQGELF